MRSLTLIIVGVIVVGGIGVVGASSLTDSSNVEDGVVVNWNGEQAKVDLFGDNGMEVSTEGLKLTYEDSLKVQFDGYEVDFSECFNIGEEIRDD
jgi:hypothetical protein